jgi:tetratricopeptide (TPR) repeat protein
MAKKTNRTAPKTPEKQAPASSRRPAAAPAAAAAPIEWPLWIACAAAFLLFMTGVSHPLLAVDDHAATVNNEAVKNFPTLFHINLGMYAPVTWWFYGLAYRLQGGAGEGAFWYHLFSVLLHTGSTWLVYRILRSAQLPVWGAFIVALLFAVHPIQVESVSWVAGMSTPLYGFFMLWSLYLYLKYEESNKRTYYGFSLTVFAMACLSKSAAVVLPLLLVWWEQRKLSEKSFRHRMADYTPFFLLSLFFGLLTIYTRNKIDMPLGISTEYNPLERLLILFYTPLFYISKLFLPLKLNIYYSFDKIDGQLPLVYWLAPLASTALLVIGWKVRQTMPLFWLGLGIFIINHIVSLPYAPLGSFEMCSDHYNYIACIGFFLMLYAVAERWAAHFPGTQQVDRGVLLLFALLLAALSFRQIGYWKNTLFLMNNAIENGYYSNGKMYYWRGMEYGNRAQAGDQERALADFNKALEMDSTLYDAYKYRGAFLGMKGQYQESVSDLTKYLSRYPNDPEYRFNRAVSFINLGNPRAAIDDLNVTLQYAPGFYQAYRSRSNAYRMLGDTERAAADMAEFERRKR